MAIILPWWVLKWNLMLCLILTSLWLPFIIPNMCALHWLVVALRDTDWLRVIVWDDLKWLGWVALVLCVIMVDLRLCVLRYRWLCDIVVRKVVVLVRVVLEIY